MYAVLINLLCLHFSLNAVLIIYTYSYVSSKSSSIIAIIYLPVTLGVSGNDCSSLSGPWNEYWQFLSHSWVNLQMNPLMLGIDAE